MNGNCPLNTTCKLKATNGGSFISMFLNYLSMKNEAVLFSCLKITMHFVAYFPSNEIIQFPYCFYWQFWNQVNFQTGFFSEKNSGLWVTSNHLLTKNLPGQSWLLGSLSHREQYLWHASHFNFGPKIQGSKAAFWARGWGHEVEMHSFNWWHLLASSRKIRWRHQKQTSINVQFW